MQFGVFSNGERGNPEARTSYDLDLREIVAADRLAMEEAWVSEHLVLEEPTLPDILPSADLLIAKAAGLTERIRLGPAVRAIALHHPVRLATEANVCDHLTGGRYMLGFGTGKDGLMPQLGLGPENDAVRRGRMREALDLMLRCWTTPEPFDHQGVHWQGRDIHILPGPVQRPHVPLAIASKHRAEIEMAAHRGIGLLMSANDSPRRLRDLADIYAEACAAAGRRPASAVRLARYLYVSDSPRAALAEARPGMSEMIEMHKSLMPWKVREIMPPSGDLDDLDFDYLVGSGHYIVGDGEQVYQAIRQLYEEVGGFEVLLFLVGHDYAPPQLIEQSMAVFMREVAPRLRELTPAAA